MAGRVFRRCSACRRTVKHRRCENPDCTGTRAVWAFVVDVGHGGDGKRRQVLRSGFESKEDAEEALADLLAARRAGYTPTRDLTVAEYLLDRWLPRTRTSEKTRHDRDTHMRAYVTPRIGKLQLQALSGDHLTEMYDDLAARGRTRRPDPELGWGLSPTTIRRIHTQLHKAFADAIRWGLLQHNPCDRADPPSTNDVKARALASRQVFGWSQLQRFVDTARDDRLYAMWHLFAVTGMRRSEMAALRWAYVDLEARMISVVRVAIEDGGQVIERMLPKSSSSRRAIELDDYDVEVLRQHRKHQLEERLQAGAAWHDDDLVFTSTVGGRIYPPDISRSFQRLTDRAGLPRIRLHDIRHTHATQLAGENTKVVTERLGHSTTAYTQDAYQHVLPGMQRDAARRFRERLLSKDPNLDPPEPVSSPEARVRTDEG